MRKNFTIWAILLLSTLSSKAMSKVIPLTKSIENGKFSFSIPESFHEEDVTGADSMVSYFKGDGFHISTDYGIYSAAPEFPSKLEIIDGYALQISVRERSIEFHGHKYSYRSVASFFENGDDNKTLTMSILVSSKDQIDTALAIFKTIKFPTSGNGKIPMLPQAKLTKFQQDPKVHIALAGSNQFHEFSCTGLPTNSYFKFKCLSPTLKDYVVSMLTDEEGYEFIRLRDPSGGNNFFGCIERNETKEFECSVRSN